MHRSEHLGYFAAVRCVYICSKSQQKTFLINISRHWLGTDRGITRSALATHNSRHMFRATRYIHLATGAHFSLARKRRKKGMTNRAQRKRVSEKRQWKLESAGIKRLANLLKRKSSIWNSRLQNITEIIIDQFYRDFHLCVEK